MGTGSSAAEAGRDAVERKVELLHDLRPVLVHRSLVFVAVLRGAVTPRRTRDHRRNPLEGGHACDAESAGVIRILVQLQARHDGLVAQGLLHRDTAHLGLFFSLDRCRGLRSAVARAGRGRGVDRRRPCTHDARADPDGLIDHDRSRDLHLRADGLPVLDRRQHLRAARHHAVDRFLEDDVLLDGLGDLHHRVLRSRNDRRRCRRRRRCQLDHLEGVRAVVHAVRAGGVLPVGEAFRNEHGATAMRNTVFEHVRATQAGTARGHGLLGPAFASLEGGVGQRLVRVGAPSLAGRVAGFHRRENGEGQGLHDLLLLRQHTQGFSRGGVHHGIAFQLELRRRRGLDVVCGFFRRPSRRCGCRFDGCRCGGLRLLRGLREGVAHAEQGRQEDGKNAHGHGCSP